MAQKYYNTAETAKLLGKSEEDVKKMLERRELHGYRDGADWKFKAENIDKLAGDSLPESGAEEGGDVLLSDAELGQSDTGLSGTVIGLNSGAQVVPDSDIRLAGSDADAAEEGAKPADEKKKAKTPKPTADSKAEKFEELDLSLDDSTQMLESKPASGGESSFIDLGDSKTLEDDNLVLGGGSSKGSDVTIGGDSGISLVDPSDSGFSLETPVSLGAAEESLELGEDDMLSAGEGAAGPAAAEQGAAELQTDDEFQLTPLEEVSDAEESESGSQVIALDTEGDESGTMVGAGSSMAAMLDEDVSAQSPLGFETPAGGEGAPVLGGQPASMAEGAALTHPSAFEPPYTGWQIAGLAVCVLILMFCGMMMFDLLRNMWSWNEAFTINSQLMDTIIGWIG